MHRDLEKELATLIMDGNIQVRVPGWLVVVGSGFLWLVRLVVSSAAGVVLLAASEVCCV